MTQEEKQLLLKDLCARQPFGVKVSIGVYSWDDYIEPIGAKVYIPTLSFVDTQHLECHFKECMWTAYIGAVRPYLRPISDMTEDEMNKLFDILHIDRNGGDEDWVKINDFLGIKFFFPTGKWVENVAEAYDYLNAIHIDYRGLIPMGLALEAPEGMYNT